jgi:hypothetical protein
VEFRLKTYDRLGAERGPLPYPISFNPVNNHNDLPTLRVQAVHNLENELDNDPEVAVEYCADGTNWIEPRNSRFRLQGVDFDHLDTTMLRSYDFIGVGEGLRGQTVYGAYGKPVNDEGKIQFKTVNAGTVIKTIWDNAVSRGWTGYSLNFTTTTDSLGQPWNKTFTAAFDIETSLQSILEGFVDSGVVDYWWQGRTLNISNYNSLYAFTDHTLLQNSKVQFPNGTANKTGVDSSPEKLENGPFATHVVVLGENKLRWEFPTGVVIPEGRREIVLRYSGVNDTGSAQILADPVIQKAKNVLKNTTRQFHLTPQTEILPYVSYKPGDWLWVYRDGALERMRIQAVSLTTDRNSTQGYIQLGDRVDDLLAKMYKRIQGMTGGVGSVGAGTPPAPAKPRLPTAPTGLVVNDSAFISSGGLTLSTVDASWAHDGKDVLGNAVDIQEYRFFYRKNGTLAWTRLQSIQTGTTTSYGGLSTYTAAGTLASYQFAVTAVSSLGAESAMSALVTKTMNPDTIAPPDPTDPLVKTFLRSVRIIWDGLGKGAGTSVTMPADFTKVNIYESLAADMSGQVKVGELQTQGVISLGDQPADVTRYYRMNAEDRTGNVSGYTAIVSVVPKALVQDTEIAAAITQLNTDITTAQQASDRKITISANAPTTGDLTGKPAMATWTQMTGGKVVGAWYKATAGAGSWTPTPFDPVFIPQINIGGGTFGDLDGIRIKAKTIGASQLIVTDQDSYVENGLFETGDLTGWTVTGGWAINASSPQEGSYRALVQYNGTTQGMTNKYPVYLRAGDKVKVKLFAQADTYTSGVQLGVGLKKLDNTVDVENTGILYTNAAWTEFTVTLTAVAEGWKNLYLYTSAAGGGFMRIDNVRMYRMNAGELVVDGSIKAIQIDTNNLASDTGFIGTLKSTLIVSDVFVGKSFTGGTFDQATFQTTSTALRGVKMTSTGIKSYDDVGNVLFNLDATDGYANIAGRFYSGKPGTAGFGIIPAQDSYNLKQVAILSSPNGTYSGSNPAGMWVQDATVTTAQPLHLRGHYGGDVQIDSQNLQMPTAAGRVGNFSSWALGDTSGDNNYLPSLMVESYLKLNNAPTVSASANLVIATAPVGRFYKVSSSIRYKADVQDWAPELRALRLRPRSWVDRNPIDSADPFKRYYGYIAEEVEEIFPEFVTYNDFSEPESVTYDRMPSPATVAVLKNFDQRLKAAGL